MVSWHPATVVVVRQGRPMPLRNSGDTLVLTDPAGQTADTKAYGLAARGLLFSSGRPRVKSTLRNRDKPSIGL
jgi:hypothetical protein